tara:strand:+ start:7695 stop:9569 length:1875 start_codon:yes stop_codon:yes gene_type:complete
MPQQIIIAEQMRIAALLSDERVDELIVAKGCYQIGDIYLGTVENVLPGIDAAFVNIGESEKNGFIHVSDLGPLRLKQTSASITELLEPKQEVLVQVIKEPTGNKGPRLTGNVSLPGRYLILQPHGQGVNISRKINAESERNRLRALGVLIKPPGSGLVIRTEANSVNEELLIDDLENLLSKWEAIQQSSEGCNPPNLISRDEDFIEKVLRDNTSSELTRVVVEQNSAIDRVKEFLNQDGLNVVVECHKEPTDLLQHYKINLAIQNALHPRVDLPSGGYIIIEPTEALTVIDVNSGSFTRSANARETVLWTNIEAAKEIARQLKLRNIGGVIIIDFIDMDSRKDQLQLLEHFTSAIKDDAARPQIAQLTELGLVELTRKRQGQNIYELFGKACPNCFGLGHIPLLSENNQIQLETNLNSTIKNVDINTNENKIRNEEFKNKIDSEIFSEPSINLESNENPESLKATNGLNNINEDSTSELSKQKQKPELISIEMNEDEEDVYSSLGINPKMKMEDIPSSENLIVHIIRPGDNAQEVLEKAQLDLINNSTKQRRKGRNLTRNINKSSIETQNTIIEDEPEQSKDSESKELAIIDSDPSNNSEINESSTSVENEDNRRKRRRSSASS